MLEITNDFARKAKTCNLYLSFIAVGLCVAVTGPSLIDLQNIVNTDTHWIALIFPARGIGYVFGSLGGGIIFDKFKRQELLLTVLNLLMTFLIFSTPWCRMLELLVVVMIGSGLMMGAIDTGSNVFCLNLWGEKNGPFFQALHFAFSIGAFIAPLIAAPFLSNSEEIQSLCLHHNDSSNATESLCFNKRNITNDTALQNFTEQSEDSSIPKVTYAYTIIGVYAFLVTLMFAFIMAISPNDEKIAKKNTTFKSKASKSEKIVAYAIIVLTGILLCIYVGIEMGFAQMVATYAVKSDLKMSKPEASYVTSVFWVAFSIARGLSICLAMKFCCLSILIVDLFLAFIGGIILLTLGTVYKTGLWVGSGILGFGIASFFPSVVAWVERYINLTNKMASVYIIGAALGDMIMPLLISFFIDETPIVLFYVIMASIVLCALIVLGMWTFLRGKKQKYEGNETINVKNKKTDRCKKVTRF